MFETNRKMLNRKESMAEANTNTNPADSNESANQDNRGQANDSTQKSFSQEELNEIISKRINKENAKNEEKMKQAIQEAKIEWEKQSQMSDEERKKEEITKQEQELRDRETRITLKERNLETLTVLQEKGMPTQLAEYLIDVDKDKTEANVEKISKVWDEALSKAVTQKLAGTTPLDNAPNIQNEISVGRSNGNGTTSF